jgi:hypothetical protein
MFTDISNEHTAFSFTLIDKRTLENECYVTTKRRQPIAPRSHHHIQEDRNPRKTLKLPIFRSRSDLGVFPNRVRHADRLDHWRSADGECTTAGAHYSNQKGVKFRLTGANWAPINRRSCQTVLRRNVWAQGTIKSTAGQFGQLLCVMDPWLPAKHVHSFHKIISTLFQRIIRSSVNIRKQHL